MITRQVKLQLLAFAVITVVVMFYGATRYLGVGDVVNPPYRVEMQVSDPGGLYPRADVELLGTRVGRVDELLPGPGQATTVVLLIDHDVEISSDLRGAVAAKSAIGEGYVALTPLSEASPLEDGDVIPLDQTTSPIRLERLLGNLDALARSIPLRDLSTLLRESELALTGLAPSVGRLVDGGQTLADDALANVEDITSLIRQARLVMTTQVELGPETRQWARELAGLLQHLRSVDPELVSLYDSGLRASTAVTNLLADNQPLLPVLFSNLVSVTTVAQERIPQLRKTLVVFPWILENQVNTARYCDDYDPQTGRPVASTCHYDDTGEPIYTLHLSQQLDKMTGIPYLSCTRGYEGTRRYDPLGRSIDGSGAKQSPSSEPNLQAHCAAPPTDPISPNVRGAQNVTTPAYARPLGVAPRRGAPLVVFDPQTGLISDGRTAVELRGSRGAPPPTGPNGLEWLLTNLLEDQ